MGNIISLVKGGVGMYALIVGASGGIGLATAKKLREEGYEVYLHYNTKKDLLIKEFENDPHTYLIQADLSVIDGVHTLIQQIHHPIDCLIYAAGVSKYGLVYDFQHDELESMMMLHQKSLYLLVNQLLPNMVSKRNGNIVVISSVWGQVGASCEVLYSMTKGAQIAYVKALAKEVAPSGIRVNGIAPGAVRTEMLQTFTEEELSELAEEIPLGRIGEAEEIAESILFMISSKSSYMTGSIINVNGGWYM